jgi:very-short-patch-repair endonuclease
MNLPPNNWSALREHYAWLTPKIMAEAVNEWATDPYAWNGMVHMTPIEYWLWHDIRECDCVLYPQYPVGRVFLDFANPKAKVGIECDGAAYHQDKAKDAARDAELAAMGWSIYRITGSDCRTESDFENGRMSRAGVFMRRIAVHHGLSRGGFEVVLAEMLARHDAGEMV